MDEKIAAAGKDVLVEIIKLAQKRGMKGSKGNWKEFLSVYDSKFGVSLSDPARRSTDSLVAFLTTFSKDDLKIFDKVMQCHFNRDAMESFRKNSSDTESPEQKLVRTTLEHPQYPLNYSLPSYEEGWLVTKHRKMSKSMQSTEMLAVDCEMVLCEDGTEALVRVSVVDCNLQVKLDELVNPNKAVADYRTEITGVSAKDIDGVTYSLADVQKSLKNLLRHGTILVGHSLNNDLQALKLDHAKVIDTSFVFKYGNGNRRASLSDLCKASLKVCVYMGLDSVLGYELRKKGTPLNSLDDARAAMKLVLAKLEGRVNSAIPFVRKDVPEIEMAKLLLHRIPISVPSEELHKLIPGDSTIEVKANKKAGGGKYSAFAIFKNDEEANQAFEDLDGSLEKDSSGLPQKLISFQLDTGRMGSLYIRKMSPNDQVDQIASKKRPLQDEEISVESKKTKKGQMIKVEGANRCDSHLKEIERLKQELRVRDEEISNLNKIVVALTRKQGL
ncbi:hypothetical protein LguiB_009290 [Lonicera macranthoides]